ncbi:MAG: hypothetical protein WCL30_00140 [Pseudomonadota bacterium]
MKGAFTPIIAVETEFYLINVEHKFTPEDIISIIRKQCSKAGVELYSVEKETGNNQYEIATFPGEPDKIISDSELCKQVIKTTFAAHAITADFSAKPLADQPGSGLHIHIHLQDEVGRNIFTRDGEGNFSPPLLHAIAGLLATMQQDMAIFAPSPESLSRFVANSNAPTTLSWGINNRTAAIRLPNKPSDNKHIEHRVAGSDADIAKVTDCIIKAVFYGIAEQLSPGEPIYGDAALPKYKLPLLTDF